MLIKLISLSLLILLLQYSTIYPSHDEEEQFIEHRKVYYESGMFAGWPANHGIWIWENEIVVGFSRGYHLDRGHNRHNIHQNKTELHLLARSLDGGINWTTEDPGKANGALVVPDNGAYHGAIRNDVDPQIPKICTEKLKFNHPDFALTIRSDNNHAGEARYWYSYDRAKNWSGPCKFPDFGLPGIGARTDYIVNGNDQAMLFLTAAKSNGREGRPFVIETLDGGQEWNFKSWIGPEPEGFSIMPASARIFDEDILVTIRRREGENRFISSFISNDNGINWINLDNPVNDVGIGNPPAIIRLKDGSIVLAYAYRSDTGSRMELIKSTNNGKDWSDPIVIRGNDGAGRDVGYPRMVQRKDGKLVVIYYWNHALDNQKTPYRYIAATIVDQRIF